MIRYSIPLISQACLSLTNLFIGLLLIKQTSAREYGLFVLGFSIMLFVFSIQDSLVSIPVTIRASGFQGLAKSRFLEWNRRLLHSTFLIIALLGICIPLLFPNIAKQYSNFIIVVTLSAWGWGAWEFQRTITFAKGSLIDLIRIDGIYLIGIIITTLILWVSGHLNALNMITIMGIMAISSAYLFTGTRSALELKLNRIFRAIRYWWAMGCWSFIANQITCIQSQAYIYLISSLIDLDTLASVSASRLLFAPLATIMNVWTKITMPKIAYHYMISNSHATMRVLYWSSAGLLALTLLWAGIVFSFQGILLPIIFQNKYSNISTFLNCWTFSFCMSCLSTVWLTGLRSKGEFKTVSRIGFAGSIITVLGTFLSIKLIGAPGAILTYGISDLIMTIIAISYLYRNLSPALIEAN